MGWLDTDNKTISVQLNLTGTATGTELGKNVPNRGGWEVEKKSQFQTRNFENPWGLPFFKNL